METREELLNGLGDAADLLRRFIDKNNQLPKIRSQYRNTMSKLKWKNIRIGYIIFVVVFLYIYASNIGRFLPSYSFIPYIIIVVATYFILKVYYKTKNASIDKQNERIRTTNENTKMQEQQVVNEIQEIQQAYHDRISYWYPSDYCSIDAAEFFYNVIKNYRADSMKEAINLYENTMHQRRLEANQKEGFAKIQRQQKIGNLLALGSVVMQGQALKEMIDHNAKQEFATQETNRTLRDIQMRL